jgi:hypothetical protein
MVGGFRGNNSRHELAKAAIGDGNSGSIND